MPRKRYTAEEIVTKLRQVDVLTSQGRPVAEAVRTIGVTEVTYYRWRSEYRGLKGDPGQCRVSDDLTRSCGVHRPCSRRSCRDPAHCAHRLPCADVLISDQPRRRPNVRFALNTDRIANLPERPKSAISDTTPSRRISAKPALFDHSSERASRLRFVSLSFRKTLASNFLSSRLIVANVFYWKDYTKMIFSVSTI